MPPKKPLLALILLLTAYLSPPIPAQTPPNPETLPSPPTQPATPNQPAQECQAAAQAAATEHRAQFRHLHPCHQALAATNMRQQDRAATHANRGLIYFTLGNPAAAERDYTAALALNPPADQRAALLLNRGNLHFVRQNYQKALADYDQALKLGLSQTQIPHFNRGLALAQLNQPDAALAAYRAALAALPGWPPAQQKIAQLQSAPPPQ